MGGGKLVAPTDCGLSDYGYFIVVKETVAENQAVSKFVDWFQEESGNKS